MGNNNAYMLRYSKEDLPQYAFKEIIEQIEEPSLLNYGFLDGGYYTVCDIVPSCKHFCKLNVQLEESDRMQNEFVEHGKTDFIVTRDKELDADLYECVAQQAMYFEGEDRIHRLYALKSLGIQGE